MIRKEQLVWSKIKVGMLVLGAIGLLIAASIAIEGSTSFFQTTYRAHFQDIVGLKVGAPVRLIGVDVGNVKKIHLAEDALHVEVVFSVENTVVGRLRGDATALVRAMSVLGDKILVIHPGTPSNPPLEPNSVLPGTVELEIAGIAPSAESTLLNLNQALLEIRQLVASIREGNGTLAALITDDDAYVEFQQVLRQANTVTANLARLVEKMETGDGTVGRLIATRELYDRMLTTAKQVDALMMTLNRPDGTLARLTSDHGELYRRLGTIATYSERIVGKLEMGEGTVGRLLTDEEVYSRVDRVLSEVELLIADIKSNPTRYFKFSVF